jgi:transcription-repair coupling factor (superfamily II helicase)
MDQPAAVIAGLSAPAKALYVAAAAQQESDSLILYVVPADAELEQAAADVRFFFGALEGSSAAALERTVLPFPSHEIDPYRGLAPHLGVTSARARALHAMATGAARVIVTSAAALLPRVSAPDRLLAASRELKPGDEIPPDELADLLVDAGFTREDPVDERGEFGIRGGIVDIFPAGEPEPVRLEFVGDVIESMRRYDPGTQRSTGPIDQLAIRPIRESFSEGAPADPDTARLLAASIFDYAQAARPVVAIVSEREEVNAHAARVMEQAARGYEDAVARGDRVAPPAELFVNPTDVERRLDEAIRLETLDVHEPARAEGHAEHSVHIACQPAIELRGKISAWVADVKRRRESGDTILFVAATAGRAERIVELLKDYELLGVSVDSDEGARYAAVLVTTGGLSHGFRLPDAALQIYAETDVFEEERHAPEGRRSAARTFLSDLRDLKVGDFVVHVDHGIGAFVGLKQISVGDSVQEFLELRYAGEDKLFVPVERLDLVQKYTGGARPSVDKLGTASWEKAKTRVKKAMRDMAEELLKLYAARKAVAGYAFSPDTRWQQEFEDAFEWELTPDQRSAISDIKADMESSSPMDRLLCGDVGYGKTEVSMRAAFKAVMDGKQAAFLAPTTVLAFQHQKTLTERFAGFPVRIDMVSRFRSKAEQKATLADLEAGKLDIIVGTHRLLSKDVHFRDLGLLVVDEEQRFGVAHKEKIKQLRRKVDVLTMTATPIPRTLNMSLVGIRDMSIIETPPKDRLSIQTNVIKFNPSAIGQAIRQELARGGQVYFVHNRVESIFSIGNLISRLVPEAKIAVGHGQMGEEELERAMLDFIARKYDILLATTIIENGLDIPNVNTIIINRADRYGLSQLYQLRGRVGRSDRPAYAYLLIPPEDSLSPVAKKRLAAIKEFSDLGSGFRVAALDLEIRGAGNLLGGEQSGQIDAVGFEMYMKLLEDTIRQLKGEELEDETRTTVNLQVDLRIDEEYVPDMNQRLMVYRQIAGARSEAALGRAMDGIRDRYGPPPDSVLNLADYARLRIMAEQIGIESIDREGQVVVLKFKAQTKVDPTQLVALVRERPELTLIPPAALRLRLDGHREPPGAPRPAPGAKGVGPSASRPAPGAHKRSRRQAEPSSWWTTRAKEGEVRPGFSKAEILKRRDQDPRLEGGLFDQLGDLLVDLAERR